MKPAPSTEAAGGKSSTSLLFDSLDLLNANRFIQRRMLPKLNTRERDPDAAGRASGQTIESSLSAITVEVYELHTRNKVRRNERDILSV